MAKRKISTEIRMPAELQDALLAIANLAGVTLEAVICVALAKATLELAIQKSGYPRSEAERTTK